MARCNSFREDIRKTLAHGQVSVSFIPVKAQNEWSLQFRRKKCVKYVWLFLQGFESLFDHNGIYGVFMALLELVSYATVSSGGE